LNRNSRPVCSGTGGRFQRNTHVPVAVFRTLFSMVFTGKNLFRTLESSDGTCGMAKDTVYRFLNSVHTNWRRFLLLLSSRVITRELEPLTGAANMKVLIADDTLYRRNRSKHVELLSRIFDHTDNRYCRGFRMLTLGWSDGISFLPVSCALLASSKKRTSWLPCVWILTVARSGRDVAGNASARQPMSLWRWSPKPLPVGFKPVTFCSTVGSPIPQP